MQRPLRGGRLCPRRVGRALLRRRSLRLPRRFHRKMNFGRCACIHLTTASGVDHPLIYLRPSSLTRGGGGGGGGGGGQFGGSWEGLTMSKLKVLVGALLVAGSFALCTPTEARVYDFQITFTGDGYGGPSHVMTFELDTTNADVQPDYFSAEAKNLLVDGQDYKTSSFYNPTFCCDISFQNYSYNGTTYENMLTPPLEFLLISHRSPQIYSFANGQPELALGNFHLFERFSFSDTYVDISTQGVPEPRAWWFLFVGFGLLGLNARKKRRQRLLA